MQQPAATPPRLYSPTQVALATFLGWPIGGASLLAANYRRRGHHDPASMTFFFGMLGTAVLMCVYYLLPRTAPAIAGLIAVPAFAMGLIAHLIHGAACRTAPLGSWRWTAIIGVLCGIATTTLLLAFPPDDLAADLRSVHITVGERVQHARGATERDARRLGQFLQSVGYFDGRGPKTVRLTRPRGTYLVAFALKDGRWRNPNTVRLFRTLRTDIVDSVFGGHPVEVRLCDRSMRTKKTLRSTAP